MIIVELIKGYFIIMITQRDPLNPSEQIQEQCSCDDFLSNKTKTLCSIPCT